MSERPFTIHSLNNYTHVGLTSLIDHLDLKPEQVQKIIRVGHYDLVEKFKAAGVDYSELRNALVPQPGRHEAAFIFDSTRSEKDMYGYFFAEKWIPALKQHGPEKTALRVGDILMLPNEFVWRELDRHLVGPAGFPRQPHDQYFVVYMTNLSAGQLRHVDAALTGATEAYLGYVDCSTWNPLKAGMYLPQVGLRLRDHIITEMEDDGTANQVGYPCENSGFRVVGIEEYLYGPYLGHRLNNGVPAWADEDSALALTVLGGDRQPVTSTDVVIDEKRIEYLKGNHGSSLSRARLDALDKDALAAAIKAKFTNGLVYNLRFKSGSRDGMLAPELDAMMYSVQVEFPDDDGEIKRYQVGLKYTAEAHTTEIVTFY
ncbi:hypothetical protein [Ornithinimicrobium sp. W1665]|uniref:hypothetical protein n=1 Tax=Ornithinimicrobium sp. W1665 TaxID=3416666 RepID=UPI003CF84006